MSDLSGMLDTLRRRSPLIHAITNPISITQCANAVLALGCRPIMAEHPGEVEEITATASALLLNLGNITDVRMESMARSARTARQNGIPITLDAVGAACSRLRRNYARQLMEASAPAVLKGNYAEIVALTDPVEGAGRNDEAVTRFGAGIRFRTAVQNDAAVRDFNFFYGGRRVGNIAVCRLHDLIICKHVVAACSKQRERAHGKDDGENR